MCELTTSQLASMLQWSELQTRRGMRVVQLPLDIIHTFAVSRADGTSKGAPDYFVKGVGMPQEIFVDIETDEITAIGGDQRTIARMLAEFERWQKYGQIAWKVHSNASCDPRAIYRLRLGGVKDRVKLNYSAALNAALDHAKATDGGVSVYRAWHDDFSSACSVYVHANGEIWSGVSNSFVPEWRIHPPPEGTEGVFDFAEGDVPDANHVASMVPQQESSAAPAHHPEKLNTTKPQGMFGILTSILLRRTRPR